MNRDRAIDTKGLPANLDVERLVLGSIMLNGAHYQDVAASITSDAFAIEKHRRIFDAMADTHESGKHIDRITVASALQAAGKLEAVGGLGYLVSLDDDLPQIFHLGSYVDVLREKELGRKLIYAAQAIIERTSRGTDPAREILASAERGLLDLAAIVDTRSSLRNASEIIEGVEGGLDGLIGQGRAQQGLRTGFYELDECLSGGLRPGQLVIIAGRPAMGKTAFAFNMAANVALAGYPVASFSLEMSAEDLLSRVIAAEARTGQRKYGGAELTREELARLGAAAQRIAEAPLYIDDTAGLSLIDLHSKLRRCVSERGLSLVVVDYLQLMTAGRRSENRVQEVSELSRGLKLMAKDLGVPVVVLSQLSRATESRAGDHRPQLSDLRESGSIEQDADIVGFLFREEYYKRDRADLRGKAEFIVAKQRSGPTGTIPLVFSHHITRFENYAGDTSASEPVATSEPEATELPWADEV